MPKFASLLLLVKTCILIGRFLRLASNSHISAARFNSYCSFLQLFLTSLTSWLWLQCMYLLLHTVKGTPFETPDQGKARLLTHWEQMDYGVQFTASRKFLTITPIVLWVGRNSPKAAKAKITWLWWGQNEVEQFLQSWRVLVDFIFRCPSSQTGEGLFLPPCSFLSSLPSEFSLQERLWFPGCWFASSAGIL